MRNRVRAGEGRRCLPQTTPKAATGTELALSGGGALVNQRRGFSAWKMTGGWADDCKDREKYGI